MNLESVAKKLFVGTGLVLGAAVDAKYILQKYSGNDKL